MAGPRNESATTDGGANLPGPSGWACNEVQARREAQPDCPSGKPLQTQRGPNPKPYSLLARAIENARDYASNAAGLPGIM